MFEFFLFRGPFSPEFSLAPSNKICNQPQDQRNTLRVKRNNERRSLARLVLEKEVKRKVSAACQPCFFFPFATLPQLFLHSMSFSCTCSFFSLSNAHALADVILRDSLPPIELLSIAFILLSTVF